MRLIIAAILGGIVMFAWGAVSHMVLNIEGASLKPMPNEAAVTAAMKSNIAESGIYFLPGMDMSKTATAEHQAAWAAKYKEGPMAMLIYHPTCDDCLRLGSLAHSSRRISGPLSSAASFCCLLAWDLLAV